MKNIIILILIFLTLNAFAQKGPVKHLRPDETFQPGRFATESKAKLPSEEDYIMAVKTTGKDYTEVIFTYNEIKYPLFDSYIPLGDNLVSTEKNKKYGLITDQGKILISAKYPYRIINTFDNLLLVTDQNKYGIMDKEQNIIVPIVYNELKLIDDNIIYGKSDEGAVFINLKGEKLFEDGIFSDIEHLPKGKTFIGKKGENYGVFDLQGNPLANSYENITVKENLLICQNKDNIDIFNEDLKVIFSTKGKSEIWNVTDKGIEVKLGDKFGFYDLEGKNIFIPQFKEIYIFHRPKNTYVCAVSDNKTSIYNFATKTYTALDHELDVFNPKDQNLFF